MRTLLGLLLAVGVAAAQSPHDVVLPAKDYQKLLDELEQAKKTKNAKPDSPSRCQIQCDLKRSTDRPTAVLKLTYQFRTTRPQSSIWLGGQKAFATAAALDGGGPPALESTTDGLVATIESPGEHTLTVTFETVLAGRGKNEVGLEIGLPRAAITMLALAPPGPDLKTILLGTRWSDAAGKPGEVKTVSLEPPKLAKDYPLGPTDVLDMSWDAPKTAAPPGEPTLEADVTVRVDDARIETKAQLTLRGTQKDWTLALPAGVEFTAIPGPDAPKIARPADAKSTDWTVTLPATTHEAILTATLVQPRESKSVSVGPFLARGGVRQSGTIRLVAPTSVRVIARPAADVRRVDSPFSVADNPAALFRYSMLPGVERPPEPLLEFELRPTTGFVVVQPHHTLSLTAAGWKLRTAYRVTPVRVALTQLALELPAGWRDPTFAPLDLVEDVTGSGDGGTPRTLTVRFATPQQDAFELILETRWPLAGESREVGLPMPRVLEARERDVQITATAPESLELTGNAYEWDGGKPAAAGVELVRGKSQGISGTVDGPVARLDLTWQPVPANYSAESQIEATIGDRQLLIQQSIHLTFPEGAGKVVRLTGPSGLVGLRATPAIESLGLGEWTYTPPTAARDAVLTLTYAVPLKAGEGPQPVAFLWPDTPTAQATLRVWQTGVTRGVVGYEGPWREIPPQANPAHDSLPVLSLSASGSGLPLTLDFAECVSVGQTIIDRAVCQWWMGESGSVQGRIRYRLRRWPTRIEIELHGVTGLSAFADDLRVEPTSWRGDTIQLALPESRTTRGPLMLDLHFTGPSVPLWGQTRFVPPQLAGAVHRQGVWWQFVPPPESQPFLFCRNFVPEFGWTWRSPGLAPSPAMTREELDRWLQDSHDATNSTATNPETVTGRQSEPSAVTVVMMPRIAIQILGAGLTLALGLALLRCPSGWRVVALFVLASAVAMAAALAPQALVQLALPVQAGLVLLAALLAVAAMVRRLQPQTTFIRSPVATEATPSRSRPAIALEAVAPAQATP